MAAKYYTILTEVGKTKVANAAALGRQIKLTQLAVGDGNGSEYDPIESQTSLKQETYRTPISHLGTDAQNPNWVIAEGMIPVDVGGWFVREVGLFDEDGDLFAIGKYPETYKPTLAEGTGRDLYIRFIMVVSNTETIDLKIDPTVAIATREFVAEEIGRRTDLVFSSVQEMLGSNLIGERLHSFSVGEQCSTGGTVWRVKSIGSPMTLNDFEPLTVLNVLDFGADRTGVNDSHAALQWALDVGGEIYVPHGKYQISDTLLIGNDTRFFGAGKYFSWIVPNQQMIETAIESGRNFIMNRDAGDLAPKYNTNRDMIIEGFRFQYAYEDPSKYEQFNCLAFTNCKRIIVRDCYFANLCQHSIDIAGCSEVTIENITCVNGWWSAIQVDCGAGIYQGGGGTSYASNFITIRDCWLHGGRDYTGAIQIHKKGGDNILIENCQVIGQSYGITADSFYEYSYTIEPNINLTVKNCYVSVALDALSIGKSISGLTIKDCNLISGGGYALNVVGGAVDDADKYSDDVSIEGNRINGNFRVRGVKNATIAYNSVTNSSQMSEFSVRETSLTGNKFNGLGVLLKDVEVTDPRDSSKYSYVLRNNSVTGNQFLGGSSTSFKVVSASFNIITFTDNVYFSTATGFDFTEAANKDGFLIDDYFRDSNRASQPATLPEPIRGQQAFDSATNRPVWFDGVSWVFADGTVAHSIT